MSQEACCFKMLLKKSFLQDENAASEQEDVSASLLADLQQTQDQEMAAVTRDLEAMVSGHCT